MKSKAGVSRKRDDIDEIEAKVFDVINERIDKLFETAMSGPRLPLPPSLNDARKLLMSFKKGKVLGRMLKRPQLANEVDEGMVLLAHSYARIPYDVGTEMGLDPKKTFVLTPLIPDGFLPKKKSELSRSFVRPRMHDGQTLSSERIEEIIGLAEEVALPYLPDGALDVDELARKKQVTVIYGKYKTAFDGALRYLHGRFYIYVNIDKGNLPGSERGRFTVAHELGHYFIDEHRNRFLPHSDIFCISLLDDESRRLINEKEADLFASHLLIPQARFVKSMKAFDSIRGIRIAIRLATEFEVPIECAAIRYVNSNVTPCVILRWRRDGLPWEWVSEYFYSRGLRKTLIAVASLPTDSATSQALASNLENQPPYTQTTFVKLWFPDSTIAMNHNERLIEESLSLGESGALTLLYPQDSSAGE